MVIRSGSRGVEHEIAAEVWGTVLAVGVALLLTAAGILLWDRPDYTLRVAGWMVDAANVIVIVTQTIRVTTITPPRQRWLR